MTDLPVQVALAHSTTPGAVSTPLALPSHVTPCFQCRPSSIGKPP